MVVATHRTVSIEIDKDAIIALCQKHHIRTLSLFGSVIRDDFHDESDVDILVEFEPNCTPGFEFIDIQDQLSKIVGRTVDLNTPKSLSRHFRDQTVATAINIYVKP